MSGEFGSGGRLRGGLVGVAHGCLFHCMVAFSMAVLDIFRTNYLTHQGVI